MLEIVHIKNISKAYTQLYLYNKNTYKRVQISSALVGVGRD